MRKKRNSPKLAASADMSSKLRPNESTQTLLDDLAKVNACIAELTLALEDMQRYKAEFLEEIQHSSDDSEL